MEYIPNDLYFAPRHKIHLLKEMIKVEYEKTFEPLQFTKAGLKERGWTDSLIRDFLPDPVLRKNPVYKSAAPMKLWYLEDIKKAEDTEEFVIRQEKASKLSQTRKSIADQKRAALLASIDSVEISVKYYEPQEIRERVLKAKQAWYQEVSMRHMDPDCGNAYDPSISEETIRRWEVNYIRHHLTKYDKKIKGLFNKVGKQQAYELLRTKTLDAIACVYPYLADECESQKTPFGYEYMVRDAYTPYPTRVSLS
jgi:hypothetical protein